MHTYCICIFFGGGGWCDALEVPVGSKGCFWKAFLMLWWSFIAWWTCTAMPLFSLRRQQWVAINLFTLGLKLRKFFFFFHGCHNILFQCHLQVSLVYKQLEDAKRNTLRSSLLLYISSCRSVAQTNNLQSRIVAKKIFFFLYVPNVAVVLKENAVTMLVE